MTHIILGKDVLVPLIINGEDVASNPERQFSFPQDIDLTAPSKPVFQGADIEVAIRALDGAQKAFPSWARLQVPQKRAIFHKMAEVGRRRIFAIEGTMLTCLFSGSKTTITQSNSS